jgi:tetratricopeptide (TPR) repeat protein
MSRIVVLLMTLLFAVPADARDLPAAVLFAEGRAALRAGRDSDAAAAFERTVAQAPSAAAWFNLADAQQRLGRIGKAARSLEACLAADDRLRPDERNELEDARRALQSSEPVTLSSLRVAYRYGSLPHPSETLTGGVLLGLLFTIVGPADLHILHQQ